MPESTIISKSFYIPSIKFVFKKTGKRRCLMYGYKKSMNLSYEEAIKRTKEELKKEGFGVLTEIDVKETLKKARREFQ